MPSTDITYCVNYTCPIAEHCRRASNIPYPAASYQRYEFKMVRDKRGRWILECDGYLATAASLRRKAKQ